MRSKLAWALVFVGVLGIAMYGGITVLATNPSGVMVQPLAPVAQFDEINSNAKSGDWKAKVETKGVSDLQVNQVTVQPGGTNGWHMHLGPSFVIVKSGTATFYEAGDPTCTPHVIQAGGTRFEPAGDVHILRNEGDVALVNVVVQLIPTGSARSISMPDPGNCPF
jgi:quercetin dioxygenase-like cupin family protein